MHSLIDDLKQEGAEAAKAVAFEDIGEEQDELVIHTHASFVSDLLSAFDDEE